MRIESFGSRARVATLGALLEDATTGNKDGVTGNEKRDIDRGTLGNLGANPLVFALARSLSVGLSKRDEERKLSAFLASYEAVHGSVSNIPRPAHVSETDWNTFRLAKAIALTRFDRQPADVVDMTVRASGSVDGQPIADRTIFAQRYRAQGQANGTTLVIAPGFLETGRSYTEQAIMLSNAGYDVVVMDQQWAGLSSGDKGGIDRGFGIARDVAAVTARAAEDAGNANIILVGTSMGGGAGAYGALHLNDLHLNDQGRIHLDGPAMPKGLSAILQAPYFATTPSLVNDALSASGVVPGVRDIPLPATGLPFLSSDPLTLHKLAAHAVVEGITGRSQGFHASTADLATLRHELVTDRNNAPRGSIYIVQGRHDALASYEATSAWARLLGDRAYLQPLETTNHVFAETAGQQRSIFDGLAWLARRNA